MGKGLQSIRVRLTVSARSKNILFHVLALG
jgi:hypothetical protein